jgi:hypothetical protein
MKRAYASIYSEDSFQGISVPFQMYNVLEKIMNESEDIITDVFDNYEEYRDEEVEMSHLAKDGSDGCTDLYSVEEFKNWFFNTFNREINSNRIPNSIISYIKNLEEIKPSDETLSNEEAEIILENVIETLIEFSNGSTEALLDRTTTEQLQQITNKLINFRDNWFNVVI